MKVHEITANQKAVLFFLLSSFPGNCKEGNNFWLQDQNFCGNNIQILMHLGFDLGGLALGFCGSELYYVLGKMMRLKLWLGDGLKV